MFDIPFYSMGSDHKFHPPSTIYYALSQPSYPPPPPSPLFPILPFSFVKEYWRRPIFFGMWALYGEFEIEAIYDALGSGETRGRGEGRWGGDEEV